MGSVQAYTNLVAYSSCLFLNTWAMGTYIVSVLFVSQGTAVKQPLQHLFAELSYIINNDNDNDNGWVLVSQQNHWLHTLVIFLHR